MSPRSSDTGDRTYDSVRDRFRQWREANPRPEPRSALSFPEMSDATERMVGTAAGFGAGAFLLLLAATAFLAARSWAGVERSSATVAYTLTGVFLTIAGLGAVIATYNHVFRVLSRPASHH
jgi:hypothetical protein